MGPCNYLDLNRIAKPEIVEEEPRACHCLHKTAAQQLGSCIEGVCHTQIAADAERTGRAVQNPQTPWH